MVLQSADGEIGAVHVTPLHFSLCCGASSNYGSEALVALQLRFADFQDSTGYEQY